MMLVHCDAASGWLCLLCRPLVTFGQYYRALQSRAHDFVCIRALGMIRISKRLYGREVQGLGLLLLCAK